MTTIGVICAMDSEFELIRDALSGGHTEAVGRYTFYLAERAGKRVAAVICGVGKVNAAACTQMLISNFQADYVVNSGVSGAIAPDLQILDFVVADELMYHDLEERLLVTYFPHCGRFLPDARISALAAEIAAEQGSRCLRGRIVSGDQFVSDSAVKDRISSETQGVSLEMEGAAVGHVCYLNKVPFAVVRCVSDGADDNGGMDYDAFVVQAARRCAALTLALLDRI